MNIMTQANSQQPSPTSVPVKGAGKAQKEPPKFIEKVIDKVEEFLTKPAAGVPASQNPKAAPSQKQQTQPETPEDAQEQGNLGERKEYVLPKGTTITLPDGKSFETHTESKLSKA